MYLENRARLASCTQKWQIYSNSLKDKVIKFLSFNDINRLNKVLPSHKQVIIIVNVRVHNLYLTSLHTATVALTYLYDTCLVNLHVKSINLLVGCTNPRLTVGLQSLWQLKQNISRREITIWSATTGHWKQRNTSALTVALDAPMKSDIENKSVSFSLIYFC